MKVVENRFKSKWPRTVTCSKCDSVLEIEKEDVQVEKVQRWVRDEEFMETCYTIKCICCGYKNDVEKLIPNYRHE
jgi:hypothetical protein